MLDKVKLLLGIDDNVQDELLQLIIEMTERQFLLYVGEDEIQMKYDFIIIEVAIKRYNRLGNEGMEQVSVEGHNIRFSTYDFDEYAKYIEDVENDIHAERRGRVKFL